MSVLSIRPTVLQCYEIVLIVRFMPNNPPDITLPNSVVNSKTQSKKRRILFIFFIYLGNLRSRTYTCSRKLRHKLRSASVCLFCVCLSVYVCPFAEALRNFSVSYIATSMLPWPWFDPHPTTIRNESVLKIKL